MKKLLLIRHAEAKGYTDKGDYARPLSVKGEKDVIALAQKLKNKNLLPLQVVCSPSLRTLTTAYILTRDWAMSTPQHNPAVYEASEKTLLNVINHFPNSVDFMALVGHNPGIGYLLLNLTGKVRDVPPCTAIMLVFEDAHSWQEVSHETGVITYYTTPQHTN
ncbi:SixA phosphatase family protein [Mucilaginibacter terrae]|uniref:SixA phosphatase family protein n=1 Tax=Mucilaginibacter terrae TaxID=1955052 RepID=UPI00363141F7